MDPDVRDLIAVRVDEVAVAYRTFVPQTGSAPGRLLSGLRPIRAWNPAVEGVSFTVHRGESVALLGSNGSGKSTLLRAIAGFIPYQAGHIQVSAQPRLLAVGAVLRPPLSGYENILLGCLALGLTWTEANELQPEIADFSELDTKLELPMKALSSGERARLQFSIATASTPEILMVDEALGVGDRRFRKKSVERLREVVDRAGTVFFVSHNLDELKRVCERAIWLEEGRLMDDGPTNKIVKRYIDHVDAAGGPRPKGARKWAAAGRRRGKRNQPAPNPRGDGQPGPVRPDDTRNDDSLPSNEKQDGQPDPAPTSGAPEENRASG